MLEDDGGKHLAQLASDGFPRLALAFFQKVAIRGDHPQRPVHQQDRARDTVEQHQVKLLVPLPVAVERDAIGDLRSGLRHRDVTLAVLRHAPLASSRSGAGAAVTWALGSLAGPPRTKL